MISNLNDLLTNENSHIIIYDLLEQISFLNQLGINVKFDNIIDGEYTIYEVEKIFEKPFTHPINYARTKKYKEQKFIRQKDIFDYFRQSNLRYDLDKSTDTFMNLFDNKFWNFYAKNCAFITVSLMSTIEKYLP